jgi:phage terminase small subunit
MPVLSNPKHEMFAQALAKGKTQVEAYAEAGYKPDEPNAHRLTRNDKIEARVVELQELSVERLLVTVESLTNELEDVRQRAVADGQNAAAVSAIMGKAKLHGHLVDRAKVDVHRHYDDMTDEELDRELEHVLSGGTLTGMAH